MFDEEAVLAGQAESSVEESLAEAVERFDVKAFVEGARAGRASVRLYSRADLDEEIGRVRQDLFEATAAGNQARVVALRKRLDEAQRAFFAQSLDVVLEERSKDWQARQVKELKAENPGISQREITLELVARQIVEPAGFTGADLVEMAEVIPSQINRLVKTWGELQQVSPEEARVLPAF